MMRQQDDPQHAEKMNMKRLATLVAVRALAAALLLPAAPATAQSGNQWRIDYFPNTDWAGAPAYTQFANVINFNWGAGSPGPGVPADNFTARMTSTAYFYSGVYRFTTLADDEVFLTLNGVTVFDSRGQGLSGKTFVVDVPVNEGNNFVQADYREFTGSAYVTVDWQYLKDGNPSVPPPAPPPPGNPSAPSVQTRFGDYTPCIQQNIHQSNCFQSDGAWNSPNLGSIEMEPHIQIWGNCTADQVRQFVTDPNTRPPTERDFKCSKTEAGWFPS